MYVVIITVDQLFRNFNDLVLTVLLQDQNTVSSLDMEVGMEICSNLHGRK